jgi:hypothetical protein
MKPDNRLDDLPVCDKDTDVSAALFKERAVHPEPFRRQQNGEHVKSALEKFSHHLFPFGDKDAIPLMLERTPQGSVRVKMGFIQREDGNDGHRGMIQGECVEING